MKHSEYTKVYQSNKTLRSVANTTCMTTATHDVHAAQTLFITNPSSQLFFFASQGEVKRLISNPMEYLPVTPFTNMDQLYSQHG